VLAALPERALIVVPIPLAEEQLVAILGPRLAEAPPYAARDGGPDPRELDPATGIPRQPAQPSPYRIVLHVAAGVPGVISQFFAHGQLISAGFADEELLQPRAQAELSTIVERLLFRHRLSVVVAGDPHIAGIAARGAMKLGLSLQQFSAS